jgi:hypothetical protein
VFGEPLGCLSALLLLRDIEARNGGHLLLHEFSESNWRLERIIEAHQHVAQSTDMSFAAHAHRFVALLPQSLVQFISLFVVCAVDRRHQTAQYSAIELVIWSPARGGSKPSIDVVERCQYPIPSRGHQLHPRANHALFGLLISWDDGSQQLFRSRIGLTRHDLGVDILVVSHNAGEFALRLNARGVEDGSEHEHRLGTLTTQFHPRPVLGEFGSIAPIAANEELESGLVEDVVRVVLLNEDPNHLTPRRWRLLGHQGLHGLAKNRIASFTVDGIDEGTFVAVVVVLAEDRSVATDTRAPIQVFKCVAVSGLMLDSSCTTDALYVAAAMDATVVEMGWDMGVEDGLVLATTAVGLKGIARHLGYRTWICHLTGPFSRERTRQNVFVSFRKYRMCPKPDTMDPYTISSLSGTKLDAELRKYGAHTSGTTHRKQQRLWRFIEKEYTEWENKNFLRELVEYEQQQVIARGRARAAEILLETPPANEEEVNALFRRLGEEETTPTERRALLRALRAVVRPNPQHLLFEEDNAVSGL